MVRRLKQEISETKEFFRSIPSLLLLYNFWCYSPLVLSKEMPCSRGILYRSLLFKYWFTPTCKIIRDFVIFSHDQSKLSLNNELAKTFNNFHNKRTKFQFQRSDHTLFSTLFISLKVSRNRYQRK